MQMNRTMQCLFFEIKRSLPAPHRGLLKMSEPAIGNKLVILHSNIADPRIKDLIERLLEQAGQNWTQKIKPLDFNTQACYSHKKKLCNKLLRH